MALDQSAPAAADLLDPEWASQEECAGLLPPADVSQRGGGHQWRRHALVSVVLVGLLAALVLLASHHHRPWAATQPGEHFEAKSEFDSVADAARRESAGLTDLREGDESESAALLHAVNHIMGEDVREAMREEAAEAAELERRRREEALAEAAAKKAAAEILAEMERRQREQDDALKAALEEQREEALEEARRKAARIRAKEMEALRKQQEEEAAKVAAKARERCLERKKEVANLYRPTLYCLSLMMPFGYEPGLLAEQWRRNASIFSCDAYEVFSNSTTLLPSGEPAPVNVTLMNGSLAVKYGGRWGTAMNTGVFNRLWTAVVKFGRYRHYDWTVKVDPDAVFFPHRLVNVLSRRAPMNTIRIRGPVLSNPQCGQCKQLGFWSETCPERVRRYQREQSKSCAQALEMAAREPPFDCGCECDDFACDEQEEAAMYINNCKWGLHGPIEVFSRRAIAAYVEGLPQCADLLEHPWGEDKFIDQCMQRRLNITRVNEYDVLSETACGEQPSPCKSEDVSFHPFKSIDSYFTCHNFASRYGKGPEDLDCDIKPKLTFDEAAYMK